MHYQKDDSWTFFMWIALVFIIVMVLSFLASVVFALWTVLGFFF